MSCSVADCSRPAKSRGYCVRHYRKLVWLPANREKNRASAKRWKDRNRERNRARDREYARRPENRAICEGCGELAGIGHPETFFCAACITAGKEAKWREIQSLWLAGATFPEIQAELGITKGHLGNQIDRIRKAGWELPYGRRRYAGRPL